MKLVLSLVIFFAPLAMGSPWPKNISWQTGQVIAVSQREAEPATVLFEFLTGSRYGHVGLIIVEEGRPVVYEATHPFVRKADLGEFFEKIAVNKEGLKEFTLLTPGSALTEEEEQLLKRFAHNHVSNKTPYNYSGVKNPGKLNCAQFVHEAYQSAGLPPLGEYQEARNFNWNTLKGKLKKLFGPSSLKAGSSILSPLSVVASPWMKVTYSTLPHDRLLSERDMYKEWKGTLSFRKFLERFSLKAGDLELQDLDLSAAPYGRYPYQCGGLFL